MLILWSIFLNGLVYRLVLSEGADEEKAEGGSSGNRVLKRGNILSSTVFRMGGKLREKN